MVIQSRPNAAAKYNTGIEQLNKPQMTSHCISQPKTLHNPRTLQMYTNILHVIYTIYPQLNSYEACNGHPDDEVVDAGKYHIKKRDTCMLPGRLILPSSVMHARPY